MAFADFHGNADVLRRLRDMLARDRFPHSVILGGPQGSGKYTLALMLARTMNCLQPRQTDGLPEYCGVCSNCTPIAEAEDLDAPVSQAVEARGNLRDPDKREKRILGPPHPCLILVPPDPPQQIIKSDHVRHR